MVGKQHLLAHHQLACQLGDLGKLSTAVRHWANGIGLLVEAVKYQIRCLCYLLEVPMNVQVTVLVLCQVYVKVVVVNVILNEITVVLQR